MDEAGLAGTSFGRILFMVRGGQPTAVATMGGPGRGPVR